MSRRYSITKSLSSRFFSSSSLQEEDADEEEKKCDDAADTKGSSVNESDDSMPSFLNNPSLGPKVASILDSHGDKIHDDSFLKIIRQLEFWYPHLVLANESNYDDETEFLELAERLANIASWREELIDEINNSSSSKSSSFQIPTVRFGKTEIQMPL